MGITFKCTCKRDYSRRQKALAVGWIDLGMSVAGLILLLWLVKQKLEEDAPLTICLPQPFQFICPVFLRLGGGHITETIWMILAFPDKFGEMDYEFQSPWGITVILNLAFKVIQISSAFVLIKSTDAERNPEKATTLIWFWQWVTAFFITMDSATIFHSGMYFGMWNLLFPIPFMVMVNQYKEELNSGQAKEEQHGMITVK